MRTTFSPLRLAAILLCTCGTAAAQTMNFNLDVGSGPTPSTIYGAAAGQSGQWMLINAATPFVQIPLSNVFGTATAATLTYE